MWESIMLAAEEPLCMFEKTLPLTLGERETDAEIQETSIHGYTCQSKSSPHRRVIH